MAAALRPAASCRPGRSQSVLPITPTSRGAAAPAARATAKPQDASSAVQPADLRRRSLFLAGPLTLLVAARPALAATVDVPPASAANAPYGLKLPSSWVSAETVAPGAGMGVQASPGGGRKTQAWFPPGGPDNVSVSVLTTPIGADFTALGSFGDAGTFGQNLVASSDQSFRTRGPRGLPLRDVQTASLIDARPATAPNGAQVYRIDYKLKRAGEDEPRTFYTAVALGPDPTGRFTALYTLSATATAAALGGVESDLVAAVDSFCPPLGK